MSESSDMDTSTGLSKKTVIPCVRWELVKDDYGVSIVVDGIKARHKPSSAFGDQAYGCIIEATVAGPEDEADGRIQLLFAENAYAKRSLHNFKASIGLSNTMGIKEFVKELNIIIDSTISESEDVEENEYGQRLSGEEEKETCKGTDLDGSKDGDGKGDGDDGREGEVVIGRCLENLLKEEGEASLQDENATCTSKKHKKNKRKHRETALSWKSGSTPNSILALVSKLQKSSKDDPLKCFQHGENECRIVENSTLLPGVVSVQEIYESDRMSYFKTTLSELHVASISLTSFNMVSDVLSAMEDSNLKSEVVCVMFGDNLVPAVVAPPIHDRIIKCDTLEAGVTQLINKCDKSIQWVWCSSKDITLACLSANKNVACFDKHGEVQDHIVARLNSIEKGPEKDDSISSQP